MLVSISEKSADGIRHHRPADVAGIKNTDVKDLSVRKWKCPKCGTWHDRDVNAQQNIYKIGAKMLQDEGIQITGLPVTNKSAN